MKIEEFEQLKDSSVGHSLIKAGRLYSDYSFHELKQEIGWEGLKPSHLQLFAHIPFSGITVVELAANMNISKQAVSVLVKDLLEVKVLVKKSNPDDKRSSIITFNKNGKYSIFEGMALLKGLDKELERIIGKKDVKAVHTALLKVIKELDT